MKIAFYEVRHGEKELLEHLLPDHQLSFYEHIVSLDTLPEDIECLSTHTSSPINREVMDKVPNLKLIATRTTGFDHIDLEAAHEKGIVICNVPAYGEVTVAEYTFALIFTLSRKTYQAAKQVKQSMQFSTDTLEGIDLQGKTLGVIGTGKIGQHVIKMAQGFDMHILGFDAYPNKNLEDFSNFQYTTLEELLSKSDIISLHVPLLPTTKHLINGQTINVLKKGVILINTARGEIIETEALLKALDSEIISAAALDVFEGEKQAQQGDLSPLIQKLISHERIVVTPHNAFNTKEANARIDQTTAENILKFLQQTPQNTV